MGSSSLETQDAVARPDGFVAGAHEQHSAAAFPEAVQDQALKIELQRIHGTIQNQAEGVFQQGPRNLQALPFASAEVAAAGGHRGIQTSGPGQYKLVGTSVAQCFRESVG